LATPLGVGPLIPPQRISDYAPVSRPLNPINGPLATIGYQFLYGRWDGGVKKTTI